MKDIKKAAIEKLQKEDPLVEPVEFIDGEPKVSLGLVINLLMQDLVRKQPHPWNKLLHVQVSQLRNTVSIIVKTPKCTATLCVAQVNKEYPTALIVTYYKAPKHDPQNEQSYDITGDETIKEIIHDLSKHLRQNEKRLRKKRLL